MSAGRIDGLRSLPDQMLARLQHHRRRLLVGRFDRDKAHSFADDRFTDCFRIGGVGFRALQTALRRKAESSAHRD